MFRFKKKAKREQGGAGFQSAFVGILQRKINELGEKYSAEIVFPDGHKVILRKDHDSDGLYY